MKNRGIDAIIDLIIGGASGCALALALSAGWSGHDPSEGHLSLLHAATLSLLGLGLFVSSFAIRRAASRIAYLEDQVKMMGRKDP